MQKIFDLQHSFQLTLASVDTHKNKEIIKTGSKTQTRAFLFPVEVAGHRRGGGGEEYPFDNPHVYWGSWPQETEPTWRIQ